MLNDGEINTIWQCINISSKFFASNSSFCQSKLLHMLLNFTFFTDGGFARGVALSPLLGLFAVAHKMLRDEDKVADWKSIMMPMNEFRPSRRYFPWKPADLSYPERY